MTSRRRTEFAAFIFGLVDFIEENLCEAMDNEPSRVAAIGEAAGAVPVLRDRLRENELVQAQFMMVFDQQLYEPAASRWWGELAGMDRPAFEGRAADLKGVFATLRNVVALSAGS